MFVFRHTIGIDYSGAKTRTASPKDLRIFLVEDDGAPVEVTPSLRGPDTNRHARNGGGGVSSECA